MPPFDTEPAEPRRSQGRSFLKQHLRDPPPCDYDVSRVFGAEPAESVRRVKPKVKPKQQTLPFQDEGDEPQSSGGRRQLKSSRISPFQDEPGENSESSSTSFGDEGQAQQCIQTPFALGWESAQRFTSGSFWKENMDEKTTKPKRRYDNSTRAAAAAYARKGKEGMFSENGMNPERLQKLFSATSCQCCSPMSRCHHVIFC